MSTLRRGGPEPGAQVSTDASRRAGASKLDADLYRTDGPSFWARRLCPPEQLFGPPRLVMTWHRAVPVILRGKADADSPQELRSRRIRVISRSSTGPE